MYIYIYNDIKLFILESQKIRDKLESSITPSQLHELDNRLSVIINKHKLTLQKKLNNLYKDIYLFQIILTNISISRTVI